MVKKVKWGEARVLFFHFKEEIEQDIKRAIPKKHIWSKRKDDLNFTYSAFLKLCKKHITSTNEISIKSSIYKLDRENMEDLSGITTKPKQKSIRPSL
ncbi:hypothetical protein, partial [Commensalibacter communis]|uniref:hypothetical protein n=1 Tax=Commensalibacter communis TaxID=2972786 RepID=UPI0023308D39